MGTICSYDYIELYRSRNNQTIRFLSMIPSIVTNTINKFKYIEVTIYS